MFYDKRLPQDYEDVLVTHLGKHPHWDLAILHAPGECQMCDYVPDLQEWREAHRINFTGRDVAGFAPCWSLVGRTLDECYTWRGNRPIEYPTLKAK